MSPYRVLVVDDYEAFTRLVGERFAVADAFEVAGAATSGAEALSMAEQQTFDVAIVDVMMPGMNGLQTCDALRRRHPGIRVILMSGEGLPEHRRLAREVGAEGFLDKRDLNPDEVLNILQGAAARS